MNGKHTPGPWWANRHGNIWQIDAEMHAVATDSFCYAPEKEANARLIAAAPDLLALAKMVAAGISIDELCNLKAYVGKIQHEARFLVAKAEPTP